MMNDKQTIRELRAVVKNLQQELIASDAKPKFKVGDVVRTKLARYAMAKYSRIKIVQIVLGGFAYFDADGMLWQENELRVPNNGFKAIKK